MIKFFRHFRQQLLSENKFSKYILYAIGEIILVVIGILIALQLNSWNSERVQDIEIRSTFKSMLEEINSTRLEIKLRDSVIENVIIANNIRSLRFMKKKDKEDIQQIYLSLNGLTRVITVLYDMPTTSTFLNDENITSIENNRLKEMLLEVRRNLRFGEILDTYATDQLNTIIEPYVTKNLNYAEMVKGKDMIVINKTDTGLFFNNLELENLLNLKIETDHTKLDYLRSFRNVLKETANEINNELDKKEEGNR